MSDGTSRSSLLAAKLRSLASRAFGPADRVDVPFPGGAGLLLDGTAWVLVDAEPLKSFGPALVWASRQGASAVHLLVDSQADVLARRASCFTTAPAVWQIEGTELVAAEPAPPAVALPAPDAPALAELLIDADLEVIVEDGMVRGEINGLEVARIVHGTSTGGIALEEPLLEVGVGHADRELTALLHGALSPVAQLARVVELVRAQRQPGAERHPLNQLAPERWLRARLVEHPDRIGLAHLRPIDPAVARPNLRDTAVAMALGESPGGDPAVVACSVGVDLDLVPAAADARLAAAPDARLLLVVPTRDAHPVTRELAARLVHPADVVTVDDDWRA
ncbi:MAG: hypothetical protein ACRDZU_07940 [Acidimicrobiales bacterium]